MPTTTRIEVCATPGGGSPRVAIAHGALLARRLREHGSTVRLALVAGQALLLAGDEVRIEVLVQGPVDVEIVETAGTVAYEMRGGAARWEVAIDLRDGATVTWGGQPFVVSAGAEVRRDTTIDIEAGCRATMRETLVLGRAGETGGILHNQTRIDLAGTPLLIEDLDLAPEARVGWAILHHHRCLDSTTTAGYRLPHGHNVLQLEGCGSVHRWIGDDLHLSERPASAR
ncbi:urease accessory protein UreD [Nocardioides sp. HM23]|uniref:urease accessory protein UreD n=1 Tax=Nocardioides bizhenqiangii TaxID=3095076 RepID=UPI002ACA1B23|nr:urease accessory protein UreD [Nocardioides sp. HM23]MDZ5620040.1 urease accessory protein UreD [Nocardioides sp. HM23]